MVRAAARTGERLFPLWLLVNALLTTSLAAWMVPSLVAEARRAHEHGAAVQIDWIEATVVTVALLAWLAFVGRRRAWNEGVTTLLGLPALLVNVLVVVGAAALLLHGPV